MPRFSSLFNSLWDAPVFPQDGKVAVVIPIQKPGKDPPLPNSYRPIALTSCLSNICERMINKPLVYILESNNVLNVNQCEFRSGWFTLDHIFCLETVVQEAFAKCQLSVSVFFDLEKAYGTTWRRGILRDVYSYSVRGRMLRCIKCYCFPIAL